MVDNKIINGHFTVKIEIKDPLGATERLQEFNFFGNWSNSNSIDSLNTAADMLPEIGGILSADIYFKSKFYPFDYCTATDLGELHIVFDKLRKSLSFDQCMNDISVFAVRFDDHRAAMRQLCYEACTYIENLQSFSEEFLTHINAIGTSSNKKIAV